METDLEMACELLLTLFHEVNKEVNFIKYCELLLLALKSKITCLQSAAL